MARPRKFSFPHGHWNWPFKACFSHGVRKDELIFVGGQMGLAANGNVLHPGDLWTQIDCAMRNVETVLKDLGADLNDVVKLEVYYVNKREVDESQVLEALRRYFTVEVPPALYLVPLPLLALPGAMVSVEAIAMRYAGGMRIQRFASNPEGHWPWPFSHGIRCGEMIFVGAQMPLDASGKQLHPGDPVEQARINMENIDKVMRGFGADLEDVYNINTRYVGYGTAEDWARAGDIRANIWKTSGKNGTGVPVTDLLQDGMTIRQEVTGMLGLDGRRLSRDPVYPDGSWNWPIPVSVQQGVRVGKMVFVGGQVSADEQGKAVYPNDLGAQTATAMKFIRRCVEDAGGNIYDIVKCKAYYKTDPNNPLGPLVQNTAVRSAFFNDPGPTMTGIPLAALGLENLSIEIEAVALID
jgi:enamine deaminase RidA (YjgF/YER057c/UK114 family)